MNKRISILGIVPLLLSLTGCKKTRNASCYIRDGGTQNREGYFVVKADVIVTGGKIDSVSFHETYSANVWARVKDEDKDKVETIEVPASYLGEDASSSIYLAKHIYVNGRNWTGTLRDSEEGAGYISKGEYVCYTADESAGDQDSKRDLAIYLNVPDSDQYKLGSFRNTYYQDVRDDKIKILKEESKEEKGGKTIYTYSNSSVNPYFPSGKKDRLEQEENKDFAASVHALENYLKGKQLNYHDRITDSNLDFHDTIKAEDGEWVYNPSYAFTDLTDSEKKAEADKNWEVIKDCKVASLPYDSLDALFDSSNRAFASVEFSSLR